MKEKRVFVQIDGNNLYHRLREMDLKGLLNFDYEKLQQIILLKDDKVVSKRYYIGAIREKEGDEKVRS